jgi:hypothetical protein
LQESINVGENIKVIRKEKKYALFLTSPQHKI